eukprot:scaffold1197_cov168-Chaetoceros_neogracile.AAC.7
MEYDRALYRVYEKILEDLMQTRPIFQPEIQQETNILQEDQQHAINGSSIHRRANNSIPFLWPLFIIRYADVVNRLYYGEWRRLRSHPHTNHTNHGNMDMDMDSNIDMDTHTNVNTNMDMDTDMNSRVFSRPSRLWSILRRNRAGNRSSTFSRVAIEENDTDLEEGEGSRNGGGNGNHRVDVEMTSLSQNTGLRRRNNSSSSSRESSGSSEDQNSNPNVRSQGTIRRQHEQSDELNDVERTNLHNDNINTANGSGNGNGNNDSDNENEISNAQTETTRMAQHIAQRQRSEEERQAEEVVRACSQKGLFVIMRICMCVALFHLVVLACLHRTYVGPRIAKHIAINGDGIGERMTCLEYALSTRPERDRSRFFRVFGEDIDSDEENKEGMDAKKVSKSAADEKSFITMASHDMNKTAPLLGRDEILQIKIIYGDNCKKMPGQQCSRVHTLIASSNSTEYNKESKWDQIGLADNEVEPDGISQYSSAIYWSEPGYKFSANEALMFLDNKMISFHNISIINVTLSERCLSTGSDDGVYHSRSTKFAQFLSQIYGMDAIIVNQLMYGIKNTDGKYLNGHLQNVESKARWTYSGSYLDTEKEILHNFATWCYNRIG